MYSILFASLIGASIMVATAMCFYKWGAKTLLVSAGILVAGFFLYKISAEFFPMLVIAIIIGIFSAFSLKYNKPYQFYLIYATLAVCIVLLANFYLLKFLKGIDLYEQSRMQFMEYLQNSDMPIDKKNELKTTFDAANVLIRTIIPFSYFLNAMLFAAFGFSIVRIFIKIFISKDVKLTKGVEFFKLNDYLIYCLIAGWLGTLLIDAVSYPIIHAICLNTALVFTNLYTVQAIGIIKYFALKKGFSVKIIFAMLAMLVIFFNEMLILLFIILASIGAIDFWADFRKLEDSENANNLW
ncbi:MAG: YybS family protein [Spirochaetes bacterium]|nr:YybS family protein [Spirochaetota bacterium]